MSEGNSGVSPQDNPPSFIPSGTRKRRPSGQVPRPSAAGEAVPGAGPQAGVPSRRQTSAGAQGAQRHAGRTGRDSQFHAEFIASRIRVDQAVRIRAGRPLATGLSHAGRRFCGPTPAPPCSGLHAYYFEPASSGRGRGCAVDVRLRTTSGPAEPLRLRHACRTGRRPWHVREAGSHRHAQKAPRGTYRRKCFGGAPGRHHAGDVRTVELGRRSSRQAALAVRQGQHVRHQLAHPRIRPAHRRRGEDDHRVPHRHDPRADQAQFRHPLAHLHPARFAGAGERHLYEDQRRRAAVRREGARPAGRDHHRPEDRPRRADQVQRIEGCGRRVGRGRPVL